MENTTMRTIEPLKIEKYGWKSVVLHALFLGLAVFAGDLITSIQGMDFGEHTALAVWGTSTALKFLRVFFGEYNVPFKY